MNALRVVLDVTETNMVETLRAQLECIRSKNVNFLHAHYLQQTLFRYATQYLEDANHRIGAIPQTDLTAHELDVVLMNAEYDGPQYVVNILTPLDYDGDNDSEFMVFVEPMTSQGTTYSYLYLQGSTRYDEMISLNDLETLSSFIREFPKVYNVLMDKMKFGSFPDGNYDTPIPGFVAF